MSESKTEKRRSRVFYRYVFSYAFAFLLPLTASALFISGYFAQIYQSEVISNTAGRLNQAMTSLDFQLNRCRKISENIFQDEESLPFSFPEDTLSGMAMIQNLKKYALEEDAIWEVVFYDGTSRFLFSSDTSYTIENFLSCYQYLWQADTFSEELRTVILPTVFPDERIEKVYLTSSSGGTITLFYPDINPYMNRRVLIRLSTRSLYQIQQDVGYSLPAATFLFDSSGEEVARFSTDSWPADAGIDPDFSTLKTRTLIELNGRRYLYLRVESADTGWSFATLIDSENALAPVRNLRLLTVTGTLILLLIGLVLTVLFADRSYAPLRTLLGGLIGISSPSAGNEYDDIRGAIDAIRSDNTALSNQLQSAAAAVQEYLVYQLLKGSFSSLSQFNEKSADCGITLSCDRFRVASFYSSRWNALSPEDISALSRRLSEGLPETVLPLWRDCAESNALILILSAPEFTDAPIFDFLSNCLPTLKERLNDPVTIGVSDVSAIEEIPRLYLQAVTATDYRLIRGANNLIEYASLAIDDTIFDGSFRHINEKLETLIRRGESEQIRNFLGNIVHYLQSSSVSIFQAKSICYDIVNTVNRAAEEICSEQGRSRATSPSVFLISSFETVEELTLLVEQVSDSIRNLLQNPTSPRAGDSAARMTGYIRDHCTDVDFSIRAMAEAFEMSPPNLSTAFKKATGETILDYATRLKIAKAKELLTGSNMTLQDIALEIGYYNPTSFIRRFKQLTGVTPGEYKAAARENR